MDKRLKEFFIEMFSVGIRLVAVFIIVAIIGGVCSGIVTAFGGGKKNKKKGSGDNSSASSVYSESSVDSSSGDSVYYSSSSSFVDDDDSFVNDTSFTSQDFIDDIPERDVYETKQEAIENYVVNEICGGGLTAQSVRILSYRIKSTLDSATALENFGTENCTIYEVSYTVNGENYSRDLYVYGQEGDYKYAGFKPKEGESITKSYLDYVFSPATYNNFKISYTLSNASYIDQEQVDQITMVVYVGDNCVYDEWQQIYYVYDDNGVISALYTYNESSDVFENILPQIERVSSTIERKNSLVIAILNAYCKAGTFFEGGLDHSFFVMGANDEIVFNELAFGNSQFDLSEDEQQIRQNQLENLLGGGEDIGYYTVNDHFNVQVEYEYTNGVITCLSLVLTRATYKYSYVFENEQITVIDREYLYGEIAKIDTELSMFGQIDVRLPNNV